MDLFRFRWVALFLVGGGWLGFFVLLDWSAREVPAPIENFLFLILADLAGLVAYIIASQRHPASGCLATFGRFALALIAWAIFHAISIPLAFGVAQAIAFLDPDSGLAEVLGNDLYAAIFALPMSAAYYLPQVPVILWIGNLGKGKVTPRA